MNIPDAGEVAALMGSTLGADVVLTGHSLGRNKLEFLLKGGAMSRKAVEEAYNISRRIEGEERALDASLAVFTSTQQEVSEQWGRYDGYDLQLAAAVAQRPGRGLHVPPMYIIPPGLDFAHFKVDLPTDPWQPLRQAAAAAAASRLAAAGGGSIGHSPSYQQHIISHADFAEDAAEADDEHRRRELTPAPPPQAAAVRPSPPRTPTARSTNISRRNSMTSSPSNNGPGAGTSLTKLAAAAHQKNQSAGTAANGSSAAVSVPPSGPNSADTSQHGGTAALSPLQQHHHMLLAAGGGDAQPPTIWREVFRFLRTPGKPTILAMSRPDAKKNLAALVKAYGSSKTLRELANLVLVMGNRDVIDGMAPGSARVLEQVLKLVDSYDLYGSVAYPKHHAQSDVTDIYLLAASTRGAFVNVALQEPFGLTLIEVRCLRGVRA